MSPKKGPAKGDRIEVVKVLIIAIVSFVLGFALVIIFLRPSSPSINDDTVALPEETPTVPAPTPPSGPAPADHPTAARYAPPGGGGYAPEPSAAPAGAAEASGGSPDEGDAPPEVPPGRTPEGVMLDGTGFYLKCWDSAGTEHPGSACDRLRVLEKRFSTRLYVVDRCKQKYAPRAEGKLSLGLEVDFDKRALSYWNGASSDLDGASKVATCLRTELAGLPIHSVDHKHARYRIFFTVLFGKAAEKASGKATTAATSKPPAGKGKLVNVVKDRVRVRRAPVDGDIIGKISSGNQVRLIEKKAGWCHVITPNKNEGWMTCDALSK